MTSERRGCRLEEKLVDSPAHHESAGETLMVLYVDLLNRWNRRVAVEIAIRLDTVEVRCDEVMVAVNDRLKLRAWLDCPVGELKCDDMTWFFGALNGIAVQLGEVVLLSWLPHHVVAHLREAV